MAEYRALGMMELKSIAHGYEAADQLAKTAAVEYVTVTAACPGKFIIIIRGSISAVRAALDQAQRLSGDYVVDTFLLGNPDDQVFDALVNHYPYRETNAMGIVETWTAAAALVAADQGVKAAQSNVVRIGLANQLGGKGYVIFVGEVAAVQASIEAAVRDSRVSSKLVDTSLIAAPSKELWELFYK